MALINWDSLPKVKILESAEPLVSNFINLALSNARVHIKYVSNAEITFRWIKPNSVFTVNQAEYPSSYIDAYCEKRKERRVFEVSKIEIIEHEMTEYTSPLNPLPQKSSVRASNEVFCSINYISMENDFGYDTESVQLKCNKCNHLTESFGTSESSIKRSLSVMREECPRFESNFYYSR